MTRLAPALVVAFALSTSACGAESVSQQEVAEPPETVRTARVATVTRVEAAGRTHELRSTMLVDYANDRSETVEEQSGCRWIVIGDVSYAEMSSDERLSSGKRWVRYETSGKSSEEVFEESLEPKIADGWTSYGVVLFAEERRTPDDYLDYLQAVAGELEAGGEDVLDGVATARYRTTIDTRRKIRHDLETEGWKPANIDRYLEGVMSTTQEIEVWVDEKGRVRRVVDSRVPTESEPTRFTTTTDYRDFGLAVHIEPPPVDEVLDVGLAQHVEESSTLHDQEEPVAPPSCLH